MWWLCDEGRSSSKMVGLFQSSAATTKMVMCMLCGPKNGQAFNNILSVAPINEDSPPSSTFVCPDMSCRKRVYSYKNMWSTGGGSMKANIEFSL